MSVNFSSSESGQPSRPAPLQHSRTIHRQKTDILELVNSILQRLKYPPEDANPLNQREFKKYSKSFTKACNFILDRNYKIDPNTLPVLIRLVKGPPSIVSLFFDKALVPNKFRNKYFYSAVIAHGKKNSNFLKIAKKAFDEAVERRFANVVTYTSYIDACGKNGDFQEAKKAFVEAVELGFASVVTYSSYIDTCWENGDLKKARELYRNAPFPLIDLNEKLKGGYRIFDFHGLSHGAAICALEDILDSSNIGDKLKIITGVGFHSSSGSLHEMRNLIWKWVEEGPEGLCKVIDLGDGHISLLSMKGEPKWQDFLTPTSQNI